jgi:hypothetical protein
MPVYWHNRRHLKPVDARVQPQYESDTLWRVLDLV